MANVFPRETVEFQGVPVTKDGVVVTTNIEYAIVAPGARPSGWASATTLAGATGFLVQNYTAAGTWQVWARITSSPEIAVIDCGTFSIS